MRVFIVALIALTTFAALLAAQDDAAPPALPDGAKLVLDEDWAGGKIDADRWYVLRKKWGAGNHGVVPENVTIQRDTVDGRKKNVLVCEAHGDEYDGDVVGLWGRKTRVGGVIVSKEYFASGRFEVVMKVGDTQPHAGGPENPAHPGGLVAAIWTYGYRFVEVPRDKMNDFVADTPLYNPHMPRYNGPFNEYWSELDFPEFGKDGQFETTMYNTFCQNRHKPKFCKVDSADGKYHTYTTQWRTTLKPLPEVTDEQVVKHEGYWWINDKAVPFDGYLGNPLTRLGEDRYAVYWGRIAEHWIDGEKVAENKTFVPVMAAQLTMGTWLPDWAGPAKWKTARVSYASAKVWQFHDEGDVRGILAGDLKNNFDERGREIR